MNAEKSLESTALILGDFLPYRLHNAAEKVSLAFSRIYKDRHGLNRPEWRVLAILAQFPKSTATEIGQRASMHKTQVSRAVSVLEARKWLCRRADSDDRRVEWLELTKTGRARFAALSELARSFEDELIAILGPDASRHLAAALDRIEMVDMQAGIRSKPRMAQSATR